MFPVGNAAEHVYFARDATLKDFVTSPGAARAFMLVILGYKRSHDPDERRAILDRYCRGWRRRRHASNHDRRASATLMCVQATHAAEPPTWSSTGDHESACSPEAHRRRSPWYTATEDRQPPDSLTPRQLRRHGIAGRAFDASSVHVPNTESVPCVALCSWSITVAMLVTSLSTVAVVQRTNGELA